MLRGIEMPDCHYQPQVKNIAPRDGRWTPSKSNTQTPSVSPAVSSTSLLCESHPCTHPASTSHIACRGVTQRMCLCSRRGNVNASPWQST